MTWDSGRYCPNRTLSGDLTTIWLAQLRPRLGWRPNGHGHWRERALTDAETASSESRLAGGTTGSTRTKTQASSLVQDRDYKLVQRQVRQSAHLSSAHRSDDQRY